MISNSDFKGKKINLEVVFIEPKLCGVFGMEILEHTGIMLFVNCPTSFMYVNESIVVWYRNGNLLLKI